jgi:hypothetical protein
MGIDGVKTLRGSESAASCLTVTRGYMGHSPERAG